MSGFRGDGQGDKGRPIQIRDVSLGQVEKDELGRFNADLWAFVEESDPDLGGLPTKTHTAMPEPSNWHLYTSEKPIAGNLYDKRVAVALVADDYHFPAHSIVAPFGPNQLLNDWSAKQKSTRITDYNDNWNGYRRTALLSQLTKVTDDHLNQYTAALVLGRDQPAGEGVVAAGYVYTLLAHDSPYNGLLDTFWKCNPSDQQGTGVEGTPYGILGQRHDAHFELDDDTHHGRIRFEATELDGYSEPKGWPIKIKSEMRSDKSTANSHSENKHEYNEWRPFWEAIFFVPETPNDDGGGGGGGEEGPGTPWYPPDDPGVPIPGDGTGVTLALPLMDPGAPNIPPSDDNFGYLGMATDETGQIHLYIAQGGDSEWVDICQICCESCGGGGGPFYGDGEDDGVYS